MKMQNKSKKTIDRIKKDTPLLQNYESPLEDKKNCRSLNR